MQSPETPARDDDNGVGDLTEQYSTAIIEALEQTAGKTAPDINAALSALTTAQAYLLSKIGERNARRIAIKHCTETVKTKTAQMVNDRIVREDRR